MRYSGFIGVGSTVETSPGIWKESIIDIPCTGDILKHNQNMNNNDSINQDIALMMRISIIYSKNIMDIRYITYSGKKWEISTIEVAYPRIILTLGDLYVK